MTDDQHRVAAAVLSPRAKQLAPLPVRDSGIRPASVPPRLTSCTWGGWSSMRGVPRRLLVKAGRLVRVLCDQRTGTCDPGARFRTDGLYFVPRYYGQCHFRNCDN
jgi:hypothetical protein